MVRKFIKYKDKKIRSVFHIFDLAYLLENFFRRLFSKKKSQIFQENPSILVIRRDMIGDFIISMPALLRLRLAFPDSKIYFVGTRGVRSIFSIVRKDFFDGIFFIDPNFWMPRILRNKTQYLQKSLMDSDDIDKIKELRGKVDIGIDLRGDIFSLRLLSLLQCKRIVSYDIGGGSSFITDNVPYDPDLNDKGHDLKIIDHVCGKYSNLKSEDISNDLSILLKDGLIGNGKPLSRYICIQPGGGRWFFRRWSIQNYAKLIDMIRSEYTDCKVILLSSDDSEKKICLSIKDDVRNESDVEIYESENWKSTIDLMINSVLFIGHDTSTAHLADLFDHKSIILFGPGDRKLFTPSSRNITTLYHEYRCQPCEQRNCIYPINPCIDSITVEEVFNSIKHIL
ncbi:MAG: glycosyltransferase family 9 protein [Candidatus Gracilibacteria bacterium]|nr:glycosyltransferase family 9 protein [Candidatus Gracilibacteria bacterium]